jgi:uncharacterized metal-binding protein
MFSRTNRGRKQRLGRSTTISRLFVFGCCLYAGRNPVVQAAVLNSEKLDLHIIVGLCIGHDIQFNMHSRAPTTTLIVKDRVTGHTPVISLYSAYHHPRYWDEQ